VTGDNLILSGISASSNALDTYASQSVSIFYTVNSAATVTLKMVGPSGSPVYQTSQTVSEAGSGVFTWDGRDDTGKFVPDEAYLYVLEASDGSRTDSYIPPAPTGAGSITCSEDTYDPYKNDPLIISYTLSQPARVTLSMLKAGTSSFKIMDAVPHVSGSYSYEWDGRGPAGGVVTDAVNDRCMIASLLGANTIVTTGDTPRVGTVKTDPYKITLSYGQFTKILYSLSRDATVTVTLDRYQGPSITLINGEAQTAGAHEFLWNGLDPSDPTAKKLTASSEGTYNVTIEAVNPSTRAKSRFRAYLHLSN
jgi:flagellar hook assembly protein FlgD